MRTNTLVRAGFGLAVLAIVGWSAGAARADVYQLHGDITPADPTLYDASHYDVYPVYLQAGQHLHVNMTSNDVDSYLILADPQGTWVAQDDDGGQGLNASLHFTAPYAGTYQILANTYQGQDYGHYHLVVELMAPANPLPQGQAGTFPQGQPQGQFPQGQPQGPLPQGQPQGQFPQGQFPQGSFPPQGPPQGPFPPGQFPQGQAPQGPFPQFPVQPMYPPYPPCGCPHCF